MIHGIPRFDAHRVRLHLWMGSFPYYPEEIRKRHFDVVVLCAKECQDPRALMAQGIVVVQAPLDDDGTGIHEKDKKTANDAGEYVAGEVTKGRRVLVTCYQGRNRSGLVCALALRALGYSARDAIANVRAARGAEALRNPAFVEYLVPSHRDGLGFLYPP